MKEALLAGGSFFLQKWTRATESWYIQLQFIFDLMAFTLNQNLAKKSVVVLRTPRIPSIFDHAVTV